MICITEYVNRFHPVPEEWLARLRARCAYGEGGIGQEFEWASLVEGGPLSIFYASYISCVYYGKSHFKKEGSKDINELFNKIGFLHILTRVIITVGLTDVIKYP